MCGSSIKLRVLNIYLITTCFPTWILNLTFKIAYINNTSYQIEWNYNRLFKKYRIVAAKENPALIVTTNTFVYCLEPSHFKYTTWTNFLVS